MYFIYSLDPGILAWISITASFSSVVYNNRTCWHALSTITQINTSPSMLPSQMLLIELVGMLSVQSLIKMLHCTTEINKKLASLKPVGIESYAWAHANNSMWAAVILWVITRQEQNPASDEYIRKHCMLLHSALVILYLSRNNIELVTLSCPPYIPGTFIHHFKREPISTLKLWQL